VDEFATAGFVRIVKVVLPDGDAVSRMVVHTTLLQPTKPRIAVNQVSRQKIGKQGNGEKPYDVQQGRPESTQLASPEQIDRNAERPKKEDQPIERVKDRVPSDAGINDTPIGYRGGEGCPKHEGQRTTCRIADVD